MVLSRDCRRDQGCPKTVVPMSSASLVRAKTFFAHVAFKFRHVVSKSGHFTHDRGILQHDVRGKRFNVHGELHGMERNDHQ